MRFIEAIRRGWRAPFQYYGVFDDTDYSQIRWTREICLYRLHTYFERGSY
ncbi:hypothetical protein MKY95_05235 [Paenibacillus sp. FSL P4-0176]